MINKILSAILALLFAIIVSIFTPVGREYLFLIIGLINYFFMSHPFFWGVVISWLSAVTTTFIVLWLANDKGKKKQYMKIFKHSEKWLRRFTVVILFYLAIHLACKAFCTKLVDGEQIPIGIPVLSESYAELWGGSYENYSFLNNISPQDIFLSTFVVLIIISLFLIAPYVILKYENNISIFFIISIVFSVVFTYYFYQIASYFYQIAYYFYQSPISMPLSIPEPPDTANIDDLSYFFFAFLVAVVIRLYTEISKKAKIPKGSRSDYRDLLIVFCLIPAIIVGSLVLAEDKLIKYPNVLGLLIVGLLIISGFSTLMNMVVVSFRQESTSPFNNPIWLRSTLNSFGTISLFCWIFLLLQPRLIHTDSQTGLPDNSFIQVLQFSIAIMILILLYGFLYEKMEKYQFTEWWLREWKPLVMIFSIVILALVSVINPTDKVAGIPMKLIIIVISLIIVVLLPWIIALITGKVKFSLKYLKNLPKYQAVLLVKAKTNPGKLHEVITELDSIDDVYKCMVVGGDYDVCATVEGIDYNDLVRKISDVRKIDGVASTTTLVDIGEFWYREE